MEAIVIKAVIFDLYGTLVDIKTDEDSEDLWCAFSKFTRYQADELKRLYFSKVEALERQAGSGVEIDFKKVFEDLEISEAFMYKFRELSREKLGLYDGVVDLLEYLEKKGIKRVLLSNAQSIFTMPEIEFLGLNRYLDSIYLSSEVGYYKPNPKFFNYMLDQEALIAEECLFIGNDSKCDIEGAMDLGMEAVYIHTDCSPAYDEAMTCFRVMDGDFNKIGKYIKQII